MNVVRISCNSDSKIFLHIRSFLYFCLCCFPLTSYLSVEGSNSHTSQQQSSLTDNSIVENADEALKDAEEDNESKQDTQQPEFLEIAYDNNNQFKSENNFEDLVTMGIQVGKSEQPHSYLADYHKILPNGITEEQKQQEVVSKSADEKPKTAAGRVTVNDLSDASAQECHKMYQEVRSELSDLKTRLDYLKNSRNDGTSIISDNAKINDTYNVLGKYKGLMDALNAVSISTTEAYSNKKSGSLEISGMAGYLFNVGKNIYLGFEVEGGAGFNLGNKFKLDSYSEQWEKDDTQHEVTNDINDATKGLVLQSKMIYGYVTPKFVAQIYRFILKVGPRLQFSGLSYGSDVIKIFNVGIQADALVEIKKYLSGGIKFVWSPVKGSKVIGGGSKKDNLTCKYGDLSILLCINGQYRNNTAGFYVGGSISGGWKMSKVNISKTDKFEDSSCGAGLQDYIDSLKTQDNSDDESLNTSEKNSSSSE